MEDWIVDHGDKNWKEWEGVRGQLWPSSYDHYNKDDLVKVVSVYRRSRFSATYEISKPSLVAGPILDPIHL